MTRSQKPFATQGQSWVPVFEIIFLVILGVLLYSYLLGPKITEHSERKDKLKDLTAQYNQLEGQSKVFESLQQQMREKTDSVALLDSTLPLDSKITELYILLEDLAARSTVNAASISVQPEKAISVAGVQALLEAPFAFDRKLASIPVVVNATGTVEQLNGFLSLIEKEIRLLDITNLDISTGAEDQLLFKVNLQAYVFAPDIKPRAASATPALPSSPSK